MTDPDASKVYRRQSFLKILHCSNAQKILEFFQSLKQPDISIITSLEVLKSSEYNNNDYYYYYYYYNYYYY